MKYIKKFEKSKADTLRNKYVGKYSIIKSTPYDMNFMHDDMYKEIYFLLYFVPGTSNEYMFRTYTSLIVGFKTDNKSYITINKDLIKNSKNSSFDESLITHFNLNEFDEISLYTTTKYDNAVEMLDMIDITNKYNL